MTKYIFHGGNTGVPNQSNAAFYQAWVRDFAPDYVPKILLVYYARPPEEWADLLSQDRERLERYTNSRAVMLSVAASDVLNFLEQVRAADVVYFRGGSSVILKDTIARVKGELLAALAGKICIGSSAGVMLFAQAARSVNTAWQTGLGLLPLNCFVHFSPQYQAEIDDFKKNNPLNNLEYLLIPETEFVLRKY